VAEEAPGRLVRLERVVVAVRELAPATGAFARLLGRSPTWQGERPAEGTACSAFRLANTAVCLQAPTREDAPGGRRLSKWLAEHGEGVAALAFATDDAEACREALVARGLAPGPVERILDRDVDSGAFQTWRGIALAPERTRGVPISVLEPLSAEAELAEAPVSGAAAVTGLDHVVIRTPDPDAARAFYADGLGLRLALDRRFESWGVRLLFFRVGGVTVELAASLAAGEGDAPAVGPEAGTDELWGLSWQVGDAEVARARLAAAGLDVSPVRAGRKPGTRVLTVHDAPAGVPTLMIEPRRAPGSPEERRTT